MNRLGKVFVFLLLFFLVLLIIGILFLFFTQQSSQQITSTIKRGADTSSTRDYLNIDEITTKPEQRFSTGETNPISDGDRDDRIFTPTPPSSDGEISLEEQPRLVRLFAGRTAGYRVDKEGGRWVVRLVEAGQGNRYFIVTEPYSLDIVAPGEFLKVHESLIFTNNKALVLFEDQNNEFITKSAFVPFLPSPEKNNIELFENNIRVVGNNNQHLFL